MNSRKSSKSKENAINYNENNIISNKISYLAYNKEGASHFRDGAIISL